MSGGRRIEVRPLDRAVFDAFASLFEACGSSCFCRYWHFDGTKNDWLARCSQDPDANRTEQAALVAAKDPRAQGLVALADGQCVGWMKLVSRSAAPKLRRLPVYRSLDLGADDDVYSVGCFLVHPDHRRGGVARALLAAADAYVRTWGGRAMEGYPRRSQEPMHDEEVFMGPEALFRELGYRAVHDEAPYPVLRKGL